MKRATIRKDAADVETFLGLPRDVHLIGIEWMPSYRMAVFHLAGEGLAERYEGLRGGESERYDPTDEKDGEHWWTRDHIASTWHLNAERGRGASGPMACGKEIPGSPEVTNMTELVACKARVCVLCAMTLADGPPPPNGDDV